MPWPCPHFYVDLGPINIYITAIIILDRLIAPHPRGYSHKLRYACARTARVWFLPMSVLDSRVLEACTREGRVFGDKCALERIGLRVVRSILILIFGFPKTINLIHKSIINQKP